MSDLESRIRDLTLRAPSVTMEQRVLSTLQAPLMSGANASGIETNAVVSGEALREAEPMSEFRITLGALSAAVERADSGPVIRRGMDKTVVWLVAAASLLVGVAIGRGFSTSTSDADFPVGAIDQARPEASEADGIRQFSNEPLGASEVVETDSSLTAIPDSFGVSTVETLPGSGDASQIAESDSRSPREAVVTWEQRTGQIFNVATHIRDRRFNECRECHRIGG